MNKQPNFFIIQQERLFFINKTEKNKYIHTIKENRIKFLFSKIPHKKECCLESE